MSGRRVAVVGGERLVDDLRAGLRHLDHRLRRFQQRELVRVADVHREVGVWLGERDEAADKVVDVAEAACLAALAETVNGWSGSAWRRKVRIALPCSPASASRRC